MRRFCYMALIVALFLTGCSLAEDITPPPALATSQAIGPAASPTEGFSPPTPQATAERSLTESTEEPTTASQGDSSLGTVRGRVINGTTGNTVPTGIEVHLIGIDGQALTFSESTTADPDGEFTFEELEIVPGRIFGTYIEYQGVEYFSEGRHFSGQVIDLPLIVYETTPDTRTVHVDRLHLLFDFTVEGLVEVMEVWVLSNQGDQTVVPSEGQGGLEFTLPSGFSDLRFFNEMASESRFLITDRGFFDRGPLRPAEGTELVFSFTLPFDRRLDFVQPVTYPVSATVILMPENGPTVDANGLQDLGVGDFGGIRRQRYNLGSISVGDSIELRLSGGSSARGDVTQVGLIVGAALFGLALTVAGVWWYRLRTRGEAQAMAVERIPSDREGLLRAIADLDDSFEAGTIPEDEYRRRRQTLKGRIVDLMRETHD
ncbi:MAG: hypothetical protein JSV37_09210 [Anaerolineaceae bacterium]|nr:MAG: hypothetical protein JSV37_09210 [Anaerolineaceae bacterium]